VETSQPKEISGSIPIIRPNGARGVRLKVRTNSRVEVPIGQKHWSVRS
jgi:hypothetical protein